ncbi:MAG: glycosyltransferase family 2 protein [Bacteriovoracia bacterium]
MAQKKKLSIIIPVFNEAENITRIYEELCSVRTSSLAPYEFEILFMDNHSEDASFSTIASLAQNDSSVRVIRLSRNFGYQANILTGFRNCTGHAAIQLDADGEDDPALIPALVKRWEEGFKVVYGIRRKRFESIFLSWQRKIFYRLLRWLSSVPIPVDSGDFRLIDRQVIECLRSFDEANPYLRGLIAFAGFRSTGVPYDRRPRYKGQGKLSWWSYVFLGIDGICSFSKKPLAVATWAGLFLFGAGGVLFGFQLWKMPHMEETVSWAPFLLSTQLLVGGIQLLCLGIMGLYVGRILDEAKGRPISVIENTLSSKGDE